MDILEKIEGIALFITGILGMITSAGTAVQLINDGTGTDGAFIISLFALMFGLSILLSVIGIKEFKQG